MRTYLNTLHKRSPQHKKHFALIVSSVFTLLIFGVWSFVNFGLHDDSTTLAVEPNTIVLGDEAEKKENTGPTPFENLTSGLAASFAAIKDEFTSVKKSAEEVNLQTEYEQMRNDAMSDQGKATIYGN